MAKYRVFIGIDDVLYAEVDADNVAEAVRIVQEEMTFEDILEYRGLQPSEISHYADDVNRVED